MGWWPVVHIWIPGMFDYTADPLWVQTTCGVMQVVICIFQLMWDRPVGWWVNVIRPPPARL